MTQYKSAPVRRCVTGALETPEPEDWSGCRVDVCRVEPLVSGLDVEFHLLAFCKGLESVHRDCGEMHENVLSAFLFDEAITLGVIEPLHLSHGHTTVSAVIGCGAYIGKAGFVVKSLINTMDLNAPIDVRLCSGTRFRWQGSFASARSPCHRRRQGVRGTGHIPRTAASHAGRWTSSRWRCSYSARTAGPVLRALQI